MKLFFLLILVVLVADRALTKNIEGNIGARQFSDLNKKLVFAESHEFCLKIVDCILETIRNLFESQGENTTIAPAEVPSEM